MRNICTLGLVGIFIFLGGCTSHYTSNDGQVDFYLSTLDDKHFACCELDLEQYRHDFEKWKLSAQGRAIMEEFEHEQTGQTFKAYHLPNVFRTRFMDEN